METIRKREEFWASSQVSQVLSDSERAAFKQHVEEAEAAGIDLEAALSPHPVAGRIDANRKRYPVEMMREIEGAETRAKERWGVLVGVFDDAGAAAAVLEELLQAGELASLVGGEGPDKPRFEVRLGPFGSYQEAEEAAARVRDALQLTPSVFREIPPRNGSTAE